MKKIILALALIVTLILSVLLIDTVKSFSIYNNIEKDSQKIQLYLNDIKKPHAKDALDYFEKLTNQYHVSFTKVTYVSDNKVIISSNNKTLHQKVEEDNKLKLFDSSLDIKVYGLKGTNFSEEGTYYLKGPNVQKVIDIIDQDVGKTVQVDNSILTVLPADLFVVIYLVLLVTIFITVLIHYFQNRKSDIKLLYDLGYNKLQISRYIIKHHQYYLLSYVLLSIVLTYVVYFFIYNDYYIFKSFMLILLVIAMMLFLIAIIFYTVMLQFVKSYAKNKAQNNKFLMMYAYMLLSIVIVFFLVVTTEKIIENFNDYQQQESSLKNWDTTKNIYKTNEFDIGQVKNKEFNAVINHRMKKYYNSKENNGFVADFFNYVDSDDGIPDYILNEQENADIEPNGKTITIDKHYLERHPKKTIHNENVLNKLKDDENTINILVPIQYKKYEKKIIRNYLEELKLLRYLEKSDDVPDEGHRVNIIWVKKGERFFTYHSEIGDVKNTIVNPIAIVELGYTNALNFEKYYSMTYAFESHLDDPYETIRKDLKKYQLDGAIPSVRAVYDTKIDNIKVLQKEIYKYTGLALLTSITFILTTLTFIQIYFKSYQFQIFLKRSLGYSYWSIHKWMLLFLVMLHVLMGALLLTSHNMIAISVFASITLIEALSVAFTFMKLNRENVNLVLKGKKDD